MEKLHLCVIPAKAGIHWLHVLRDPCLRRDDGEEAFFDTLSREKECLLKEYLHDEEAFC